MKSNEAQLAKRGYANAVDIQALQDTPLEKLIALLQHQVATKLTAAIYAMQRFTLTEQLATSLLQQLQYEPCLYTRLAIGKVLAQGDHEVITVMCAYLGKIGHNQHTLVSMKPSKKISYPLARDFIARTCTSMSPTLMPYLLQVLHSQQVIAIREVIDAIGWMTFYHQELATPGLMSTLMNTLHTYPEDELIVWKLMTCLSAFPVDESKQVLSTYANDTTCIGKEAKRSLQIIAKRK